MKARPRILRDRDAVNAAGLLWLATRRPISRQTLMTFTAADALWVVASAVVLVFFWGQFEAVARLLMALASIA